MMQWRHTAVVTGATLVGAWVAGTPKTSPTITTPAAQSAPASPASVPDADIEQEAYRLQTRVGRRLAGDAAPASRNPFRFRDPGASSAAGVRAPGDTAPEPPGNGTRPETPPAPPEPPLRLIGMATDEIDGAVVRTAVLSTSQGVALVRAGDNVAGYEVSSVEADAVELSGADGTRRLSLRP